MKILKNRNNIHMVFLFYWCILVMWQNIFGTSNRSELNVLIKLGLIVILVAYYLVHTKEYFIKRSMIYPTFVLVILVPLLCVETVTLDTAISYLFPCLFVFLTLIIGDKYEINQKQLISFFNIVIIVVAYMAIYAIVFCREQFLSAFSVTTAYNNELSSFLVSNHEYGLYLVCGITGCVVCLNLKRSLELRKRIPYIVALVLFVPNLILTYSRTSIFGMLCLLVVYLVLSEKSRIKNAIIIFFAIVVLLVCKIPQLRSYFLVIVLKNNRLAGRDNLLKLAMEYFKSGSTEQKLFGFGITNSRRFFELKTSHGSVHNAYLQILIYFGAIMLLFMIIFLILQLLDNFKLYRMDKFWGAICIAVLVMCICVMFVNTAFIFNSSIDSYFLTIFSIIIPKYVRNSIYAGTFNVDREE